MDSLFTLAGYLAGLIVILGVVAYVMSKMSHGDEWGRIEKLVFGYVLIALLVWLYEGYNGNPPLGALPRALSWPLEVAQWAQRQASTQGH